MINLKALIAWKDLFDENVSEVWQEEKMPVLRKLSMLLFSIKKEIKKIEDEINLDVLNVVQLVTEAVKKRDILESRSIGINDSGKENIPLKQTEIGVSKLKDLSENFTVDNPEMFQIGQPHLSIIDDSTGSIIISDDTISPCTDGSPEIKKKKRSHVSHKQFKRWSRLKDANSSTMSFLQGLSTCRDSGSDSQPSSQQSEGQKEQEKLTEEKSSMDFFKELIEHTQVSLDPIKKACKINKEQNLVLTPVRNDCDLDLSIVQCTPVQLSLPKRKPKTSSYLGKKKCKKETTSSSTTLTQMFLRNKDEQYKEKSRFQKTNYDTDKSYVNSTHGTKTSQTSALGITQMVSYLNIEPPSKKDSDLPMKVSQEIINLEPNSQEIADFVEDIRFEDFDDDDDNNVSLNSAIVEVDDMKEDIPQGINDFLAKAQNVPKHQLEAEAVVRGKARQKLPGWSCKDCEQFYTKQGLKHEEILALNKCSKHRGNYRPREDTLPGFWDMNMITQETKNSTK